MTINCCQFLLAVNITSYNYFHKVPLKSKLPLCILQETRYVSLGTRHFLFLWRITDVCSMENIMQEAC